MARGRRGATAGLARIPRYRRRRPSFLPDNAGGVPNHRTGVTTLRAARTGRFTELVGEPAMADLTRRRMHLALDALKEGATVGEAAGRLGYRFEAAFARVTGTSPGAIRRRADPGAL